MRETGLSSRLFDAANVALMFVLMAVTLYPMLYVLFASFSDPVLLANEKGVLLRPVGFSTEAYELVFQNPQICNGFKNTFLYVGVGTVFSLTCTALGAYTLSRKGLFWNKPILMLVVFTMFFSGGLIPLFLLVKGLGLMNTLWAVILPNAISAYNLIVMRTFFQGISEELIESARMDGANDAVIFVKIVLPLSWAVISVIGLFYAVSEWNSWFNAAIFLRERTKYPLQLLLREILVQNQVDYSMISTAEMDSMLAKRMIKYSAIIVSTVPILFVYPFLQKYFVKGVMIGSLKE